MILLLFPLKLIEKLTKDLDLVDTINFGQKIDITNDLIDTVNDIIDKIRDPIDNMMDLIDIIRDLFDVKCIPQIVK